MIAFIYQNTANAVFYRFGDSTMPGSKDRQSARHRFQDGIGNAFLISIAAGFARMEENVRRIKKLAQVVLRDETRKIDSADDLKFVGERLQFLELRPFTGNGESRGWKFFPESGKRLQSRFQSFFFNQPTRLQQSPLAVVGQRTFAKRKISQRNSSALNFDFLRRATEIDPRLPQRVGTDQNTFYQGQHFFRRAPVGWLLHVHQNIRAMKRNQRRFLPPANQRSQQDCDVAEINMQ